MKWVQDQSMSADQMWTVFLLIALWVNACVWGYTAGKGKVRPLAPIATVVVLIALIIHVVTS